MKVDPLVNHQNGKTWTSLAILLGRWCIDSGCADASGPRLAMNVVYGPNSWEEKARPSSNPESTPKYKTKYRVNNWPEYDRALVQRGNINLWISEDAIDSWKPAPSGLCGAQRKFSDHAIETAPGTGLMRLV
jgi:hypothetical protein